MLALQFLFISFLTLLAQLVRGRVFDLSICHDDFYLKPPDGILKERTFTWLGFIQYLHVSTNMPSQRKAPRLVLVHKQFALATASDVLHLPKNYKIGNAVFGHYDRDEEDCQLTMMQIKMGVRCAQAYLEMPISDTQPHPEFTRFGVKNSVALVKFIRPLKSNYMIPICLPSTANRERKKTNKVVFMIDYLSNVPKDFQEEKMGKKSLKLFTHKECRRHRVLSRLGSEGVTHVLCTSGCGMRPGAPIISHGQLGVYELIGLAAGGASCRRRKSRRRFNTEPPLFIDVYPYVSWIVNVITAHLMPTPYPQHFQLTDSGSRVGILRGGFLRRRRHQRQGWKARMFVSGNFCFKSEKYQRRGALFFMEKFEVNADPPAKLNVFMKVTAGYETKIVCAQLLLPNRLIEPVLVGVGGYNISVEFSTNWFPYTFIYSLALVGVKPSEAEMALWKTEIPPVG